MKFKPTAFCEDEPLHYAAERNDIAKVRELLAAGIPVDSRTREKVTPLMVASKRGFTEVVEVLIKAGANLEAHDAHAHGLG